MTRFPKRLQNEFLTRNGMDGMENGCVIYDDERPVFDTQWDGWYTIFIS